MDVRHSTCWSLLVILAAVGLASLASAEEVRPEVVKYLNRLSDLLFVIARVLAREESGQEVLWNRERP